MEINNKLKISFVIGKDFIFYLSSSIIALPITIILSPIFAKVLSAYDFAAIGYFSAVSIFTASIFTWSFYNYYMVEYSKNSQIENQKVLTSLFSFLLLIHVPLIIIVYFIFNTYLRISGSLFKSFPIMLIIAINSSLIISSGFWGVKLKYERKSFKYFLLVVIKLLSVNLLSYIFIVLFQMGATGKFLPGLIIDFLIALAFYFFVIKKIAIDWNIIKKAVRFSSPLVISVLLVIPIQYIDVMLLEKLNNLHEFALYNIANSIVGYFITLPLAILMVIEPDIFNLIADKRKKLLTIIFIGFVASITFLGTLYFLIAAPLVNYLTAGRYLKAQIYIGPFIIARCLDPIIYFLGFTLIALRLTKLGLFNVVVVCIMSFIIYPYFITLFGFMGAIYAKIIILLLWSVILLLEILNRNNKYILKFSTI